MSLTIILRLPFLTKSALPTNDRFVTKTHSTNSLNNEYTHVFAVVVEHHIASSFDSSSWLNIQKQTSKITIIPATATNPAISPTCFPESLPDGCEYSSIILDGDSHVVLLSDTGGDTRVLLLSDLLFITYVVLSVGDSHEIFEE